MLEAVNSSLLNAGNVKTAAPKVASQDISIPEADFAAKRVDPYLSRNVKFQIDSNRTIVQIRDTSTGSTVKQFPTESQIQAYKQISSPPKEQPQVDFKDVEVTQDAPVQTSTPAPVQASTPVPSDSSLDVAVVSGAQGQSSGSASVSINV